MRLRDRLLDRSIVFSFDRTGFERHARTFTDEPRRDLAGRPLLLTGGTDGIGLAAAESFSQLGAHVHLWARDPSKGRDAASSTGGTFSSVDLGDLAAVRDAAHALPTGIAGIVLNAGAMPLSRIETDQGHELIWASQVLGHLLLLQIARARGKLAEDARILWVSSGGMYTADLTPPKTYQRHSVYAHAKRAQVELSAQLEARWSDQCYGAMHPGWVDTRAVAYSMPWFYAVMRRLLRSPEQGADTIVWFQSCLEAPESGRFWFDRREAPTHTSSRTRPRPGDLDRLWDEVHAATEPFLESPHA